MNRNISESIRGSQKNKRKSFKIITKIDKIDMCIDIKKRKKVDTTDLVKSQKGTDNSQHDPKDSS